MQRSSACRNARGVRAAMSSAAFTSACAKNPSATAAACIAHHAHILTLKHNS
jgi:hypothetical protein